MRPPLRRCFISITMVLALLLALLIEPDIFLALGRKSGLERK